MIVEIKNFPIYLYIGHYSYEKSTKSQVSIDLKCSYTRKGEHDNLDEVIDYDNILKSIINLTENRLTTINLLETLVDEIAKMLMKKFSLINYLQIRATKTGLSTVLSRRCTISICEEFYRKKHD